MTFTEEVYKDLVKKNEEHIIEICGLKFGKVKVSPTSTKSIVTAIEYKNDEGNRDEYTLGHNEDVSKSFFDTISMNDVIYVKGLDNYRHHLKPDTYEKLCKKFGISYRIVKLERNNGKLQVKIATCCLNNAGKTTRLVDLQQVISAINEDKVYIQNIEALQPIITKERFRCKHITKEQYDNMLRFNNNLTKHLYRVTARNNIVEYIDYEGLDGSEKTLRQEYTNPNIVEQFIIIMKNSSIRNIKGIEKLQPYINQQVYQYFAKSVRIREINKDNIRIVIEIGDNIAGDKWVTFDEFMQKIYGTYYIHNFSEMRKFIDMSQEERDKEWELSNRFRLC